MKNNRVCLPSKDTELKLKFSYSSYYYLRKFLRDIWQNIVNALLTNHQQLQVKQKVDRQGNIYWQAYEPITGKSFTSGSEADIIAWIEQLYR